MLGGLVGVGATNGGGWGWGGRGSGEASGTRKADSRESGCWGEALACFQQGAEEAVKGW
jgi:hypothetical protein